MARYSSSDVRNVVTAFTRLGIDPTVDGGAIKKAFRAAASKEHPDHFQSESDKRRAHTRFIELAEARDVAMAFAATGILTDILGQEEESSSTASTAGRSTTRDHYRESTAQPPTPVDDFDEYESPQNLWPEESETAYEDEWRVFVADENAYFRFWDSASATLSVLVQSVGVSLFVSFLFGAIAFLCIPLVVIAIVLFVAFASASFAIPILGWIVLLVVLGMLYAAVGSMWEQLQTGIDNAALRMLQTVARTGYPSRAFGFSCLVSLGCVLALDVYLWTLPPYSLGQLNLLFGLWQPDVADALALNGAALLVTMAVSLVLVWNRVGQHMEALDAAFAKIRNTMSYGLVLASKS